MYVCMYIRTIRGYHGRNNDKVFFFLDLDQLDGVAVHYREQQQVETHLKARIACMYICVKYCMYSMYAAYQGWNG